MKPGSLLRLLCMALTATSVSWASPSEAQETVVLWHAYNGAEEAGLGEAIEAFEQEHPTIQVEVLPVAFAGYASSLESAIPTGQGPDVFIDAHERLSDYLRAHLIASLPPEIQGDDFHPSHLEALRLNGELYGLPLAIKCAALYINESLLPEAPDSFAALSTLRDAGSLPQSTYPLVFESENAYYAAAILHAYGGRLLDEHGRYQFVGTEAERTVDQLVSMTAGRVIPQETDAAKVRTLFSTGRAASAISGPWLAPDLPESLSWRVVPLPSLTADQSLLARPFSTVEGVFLAEGSRAPEAAKRLISFLAGPEGSRIRARRARQVVASRAAWEDPTLQNDEVLMVFRAAAEDAIPMDRHPNMRLVFEPAQRALRHALRAGVPTVAALEAGERAFLDLTRAPPPPADPTLAWLVLSLISLWLAFVLFRRVRDPLFRAEVRKSLPAYGYVGHAFLAVGLLVLIPVLVGCVTAFFGGRGTDMHYVGLANFIDILTARGGELLGARSFWLVLAVTVLWTVFNLALHLALGMALALALYRPYLKLKALYRVLLILPWAVPSYVTALAWRGMFDRELGAINSILNTLGVESISWFAQWTTAFGANLTTNVWLGFPFMMVITLGALTSIPRDIYEAAAVDGANAWQRFRQITLPLLKPVMAPAVAMGAIWTFNMFNVVFLVSGGEPDGTTEILVSEAYRWAFTRGHQYGYAAAYAVLIFGILLLVTFGSAKRLQAKAAS